MNEDKNTKEYLEKLQGLKLSETSRARMKKELSEYARFHAVPMSERIPADGRLIKQAPVRASFITRLIPNKMTAAFLTILLLLSSGTSFAAEGALPGDLLYPVKVEFNERVKSAVALSNEAEARLQARLAEVRLLEAETLAARGELDADASAKLNARLNKHYNAAKDRSERVEIGGDLETAAEVRASLNGTLNAFGAILNRLNSDVKGNDGVMLINNIEARAEAIADDERKGPAQESLGAGAAAVEALIKRADLLNAHVGAKLARAEGEISAEAYARIRAHLGKAIDAVSRAKTQFRSELYREAYDSAKGAIRIASEAETMLMSLLRLGIELDLSADRILNIKVDADSGTNVNDYYSSDDSNDDQKDSNNDSVDADVEVDADVGVETPVLDAGAGVSGSVGADVRVGR